jgi:hypothetical protein
MNHLLQPVFLKASRAAIDAGGIAEKLLYIRESSCALLVNEGANRSHIP